MRNNGHRPLDGQTKQAQTWNAASQPHDQIITILVATIATDFRGLLTSVIVRIMLSRVRGCNNKLFFRCTVVRHTSNKQAGYNINP